MVRRGGLLFFFALMLAAGGYWVASRLGLVDRALAKVAGLPPPGQKLSAGDFPAGVAAPVGDLASVPLRPTLIGFTPRGSSAALLLATGGVGSAESGGLFKSAYALDAQAVVFAEEEELRKALGRGGEAGGVDLAAISVDRLAFWGSGLRDSAPRTLLLLGRSRGQEALAAVGVERLSDLRGKRLGVYPSGTGYYFALWTLSRVALGMWDVKWVELRSPLEAGAALREGRADAVVGSWADVELAARDRGGKVLSTTADAPHLIATVLVGRGEFIARYPDAVKRVLRGLLDSAAAVTADPGPAARLLGEVAPYLGDPTEAIRSAPPATLADNLAFFGLAGEAPVTYDELLQSANALAVKTRRATRTLPPEETRHLGALKYVAEARGR